mgnify:CR=1 FL=1
MLRAQPLTCRASCSAVSAGEVRTGPAYSTVVTRLRWCLCGDDCFLRCCVPRCDSHLLLRVAVRAGPSIRATTTAAACACSATRVAPRPSRDASPRSLSPSPGRMTALVLLSTILESATYRPSAGLVVPVAPFLLCWAWKELHNGLGAGFKGRHGLLFSRR